MNQSIGFAKQMLEEYGEFHPYGAYLRIDGTIVDVGVQAEGNSASWKKERLLGGFRSMSEDKSIIAFCAIFNVRIRADGSDAIQVTLDHRGGYAAEVFIPYATGKDGLIEYGGMTAQALKDRIFLE